MTNTQPEEVSGAAAAFILQNVDRSELVEFLRSMRAYVNVI